MNKKGVTLVEVMISLVILLIVFMGLIQASLLSINHNLRNEARDEAVRIGSSSMSMLRSFTYTCGELDPTASAPLVYGGITGNYANCGHIDPVTHVPTALSAATLATINTPARNFRNLSITYTVLKGISNIDANTKRISVLVQWTYPGDTDVQSHTIYYSMRNPAQ